MLIETFLAWFVVIGGNGQNGVNTLQIGLPYITDNFRGIVSPDTKNKRHPFADGLQRQMMSAALFSSLSER
ncbi:MAG: hypothetical protein MZV63_23100 [Marinilabiliales bacterium]|nr:hypothetical protein [Marinilabiliales bacterium]